MYMYVSYNMIDKPLAKMCISFVCASVAMTTLKILNVTGFEKSYLGRTIISI